MTITETIDLLEHGKECKDWARADGIYADLSKWPHLIDYYCKCPVCGETHGNYSSMKEAHAKRLCQKCSLKTTNEIKDQVWNVIHEPQAKVKPLAKITQEAEAEELPPGDSLTPKDTVPPKFDVKRALLRLGNNWLFKAKVSLAASEGYEISDFEIDERFGDYDKTDENSSTTVKIDIIGSNVEYLVFKDEEVAEAYALTLVISDLKFPELFTQSWLEGFIDADRLKDAIGDPYEDHGYDLECEDYATKLEKMTEEDKIEVDDPVFFRANGEPRAKNKLLAAKLEAIVSEYISETKPDFDPWEWMRDIYGDEAGAEAIKLVGVDVEKAAADAVRTDGWPHFVASYDSNIIDLDDGAVAARLS